MASDMIRRTLLRLKFKSDLLHVDLDSGHWSIISIELDLSLIMVIVTSLTIPVVKQRYIDHDFHWQFAGEAPGQTCHGRQW